MKKIQITFTVFAILFSTLASAHFPQNITFHANPNYIEDQESEMTGLQLRDLSLSERTSAPEEQAVGFYSKGRLKNATSLDADGVGYLKLFTDRDRGYGTGLLVDTLVDLGAKLMDQYPASERIQIGDISGPVGGKISRHASHQNGLDVDLAFMRTNKKEQSPSVETGFIEVFVKGSKVTKNFNTERNWFVINSLVKTDKIVRIFVDKVIKKELCQYAKKNNLLSEHEETLRRLRPWPHHGDHMHVRFVCPESSSRCVSQEDPPEGHGCD